MQVLVATDAAGEGINLQCAHLMVNYDLPWNPNRLQQRFGRIHRIGQTKTCHLWSLFAVETREGAVFERLLEKVKNQNNALDGRVFDVLGETIPETALSKLMQDALELDPSDPQLRSRIDKSIDNAIEKQKAIDLLQNETLGKDDIDISAIRADMEEADAQRLQPYHVSAFFVQAFNYFHGGKIVERESNRFEIAKVPAVIQQHATNLHQSILSEYHRICFDKDLTEQTGLPNAEFISPGHPLLDSTISLILKCERNVTLKQGALLVDESDSLTEMRILFYIEQVFQTDGVEEGERHTISQELHFVEIDRSGVARDAGIAPYLNYRAATADEEHKLESFRKLVSRESREMETKAVRYVLENLINPRRTEIRAEHAEYIDKFINGVDKRLRREIDSLNDRMRKYISRYGTEEQWAKAHVQQLLNQQSELSNRRQSRLDQLERQKRVSAKRPVVSGGALIVPAGLLLNEETKSQFGDNRGETEKIAMKAIMDAELALGYEAKDVSSQNVGYDILSRDTSGRTRFIEVKGRTADATTVTLTRNELITALNCGERYILALVPIEDKKPKNPCYIQSYPFREPDPSAHSVNFKIKDLLEYSAEET